MTVLNAQQLAERVFVYGSFPPDRRLIPGRCYALVEDRTATSGLEAFVYGHVTDAVAATEALEGYTIVESFGHHWIRYDDDAQGGHWIMPASLSAPDATQVTVFRVEEVPGFFVGGKS
jgi:hypothetical protein